MVHIDFILHVKHLLISGRHLLVHTSCFNIFGIRVGPLF